VRAVSAHYMAVDKPQALVLFEIVKSKMTGKTPEMGQVREVRMPRRRRTAAARSTSPRRPRGRTARSAG
jgi:hypothetical protein